MTARSPRKPPLPGRQSLWLSAAAAGPVLFAAGALFTNGLPAATLPSYYAHATVQDAQGVIAPWYQGLNA